jgi:site-specific recombinase XerD
MTPLRRRMIEDMRFRNLTGQTQRSYLQYVSLLVRHFRKSPDQLGPAEIRAYQLYLTEERQLAPRSIGGTVAALRFFCTVTLKRHWNVSEVIPASRQPKTLPVVLSRTDVASFLDAVEPLKLRLILTVCYAAGLRVSEAVSRKPDSIDSKRMVMRVAWVKNARTVTSCCRQKCWRFSPITGVRRARKSGCSLATYRASRSLPRRSRMPAARFGVGQRHQASYTAFAAPRICY